MCGQPPVDGSAARLLGGGCSAHSRTHSSDPFIRDRHLLETTLRREGIDRLSADNSDPRPGDDKSKSTKGAKRRGPAADHVGKALRSAYDETLREDVPDDFLDLLGKLS